MAQDDCGLVRKVLITDGTNFNKEILDSLGCEHKANLLAIQFTNNNSKELFTFEKAVELIQIQSNVENKILLVPIDTSLDKFQELQKEFGEEEYSLSFFPEMEDAEIITLLDSCKGNKKIRTVEFIERDSSNHIEKIFKFGLLYSNSFFMGLTNIRLNANLKYGGTTPEIFYLAAGYKYFSKQIFSNARPPKEYKRFNPQTYRYEVLNSTEMSELKATHGSKWKDVLYCQNFLNVHKTLKKFSTSSNEEIQKELSKKGIHLSFTNEG